MASVTGSAGWGSWSVPGELGGGFLRAGVIDDGLAVGRGGDERGGGGVVERAGPAVGDGVPLGQGGTGVQRHFAGGPGEVMAVGGRRVGPGSRLDRGAVVV